MPDPAACCRPSDTQALRHRPNCASTSTGYLCRHLEDSERAIIFPLHDLGINRAAYEAAQEAMGWQAALLAVAIIDRNRDQSRHAGPESRRCVARPHPAPPARRAGPSWPLCGILGRESGAGRTATLAPPHHQRGRIVVIYDRCGSLKLQAGDLVLADEVGDHQAIAALDAEAHLIADGQAHPARSAPGRSVGPRLDNASSTVQLGP